MGDLKNFEAMLERGQDGDMLRFTLGNAYWKKKNFEVAKLHLEKAVEFNSNYSVAWKILGRCLVELGNFDQAQHAFNQGLNAAKQKGDKQNEKEITIFLNRLNKNIEQQAHTEKKDIQE